MKLTVWWIFCFGLDSVAKCQKLRYGLKGESIRLSFSYRSDSAEWRRFNEREIIVKSNKVAPKFKDRISFNVSDWSLTINDLQENDSGLYEVVAIWENTLVTFDLSVESIIPKPVIRTSDFNSSTGDCQTVVNCSVDGSWAWFKCKESVCERTESSLFNVNITLTVQDGHIQCNANNHVSQNHSKIPIVMCHARQQSEKRSPPPHVFWIVISICAAVLLGLFTSLFVVVVKKRNSSKVHPQSCHNTIEYAVSETIYNTVQKPDAEQTPPENASETTIYDIPTRHPKVCQVDSVEVTADKTLKVRATVHQEAEADSDPINTVYCKLGEI